MDETLIGSIIFVFSGLFIATAIAYFANRAIHRESLKNYHKLTKKAIANITNIETHTYDYFVTNENTGKSEIKKEHHRYANYEFIVDKQVYRGFDRIYAYGSKKKTTIFYDPQNPAENVSAYTKFHADGRAIIISVIIALMIIFGLPLLVIFLM